MILASPFELYKVELKRDITVPSPKTDTLALLHVRCTPLCGKTSVTNLCSAINKFQLTPHRTVRDFLEDVREDADDGIMLHESVQHN
eukprot:gene5320-7091_t